MTASREQQAAETFREVVQDLLLPRHDLVAAVRKAYFGCVLAGWNDQAAWLKRELEGYTSQDNLPGYRRDLNGAATWEAASLYDIPSYIAERKVYGEQESPENITRDCFAGLPSVIKYATDGLEWHEGERRERGHGQTHFEQKMLSFTAPVFARICEALEHSVFELAANATVALEYGDAVGSVFDEMRASVEQALTKLGLTEHLSAIDRGLRSSNPQDWRTAMWSCRDLLRDVASALWHRTESNYEPLKNQNGQPLAVSENNYINRLVAYLHLRAAKNSAGELIEADLERLNTSLHKLNDLDSKAHSPVTLDEARLAAISTYVLLAELARRTGLEPVEDEQVKGTPIIGAIGDDLATAPAANGT